MTHQQQEPQDSKQYQDSQQTRPASAVAKIKHSLLSMSANALLFSVTIVVMAAFVELVFYGMNKFFPIEVPTIESVESVPNQERLDFFQYHSVYGYAGIPAVEKTFMGKAITHNSKGLRGAALGYTKPKGVRRIAFIGDSQTWGWAVSDHETFPEFTAKVINTELQAGQVEVLNFGATGYGVDQSYLRLISEGLRYQPDIVVLTYFSDNDIWETASSEAWGVQKPYMYKKDGNFCVSNVPPPKASGWPADNIGFIVKNKFNWELPKLQLFGSTFDLAESNVARYFKNRSLNTALFSAWGDDDSNPKQAIERQLGCLEKPAGPPLETWEEKIQLTVDIVMLIKETVEANGGRFMLISKPLEKDVQESHLSSDYVKVLSSLSDRGVDIIELYGESKMVNLKPEHLFIGAGHLSAQGNYLAARKLAERIVKSPSYRSLASE